MSDAADAKRQRKAPPPKDSAAPSRLDPDYIGRAVRVLEEETGKYRRLKLLRYLGSDRRSLEVQAELDPTAGAAQEKPFRLELGGPQIYVASDVVWGCPPVEDGAEDLRVDAAAMETDPDRLVPLVLFVPLEPDDDGGLGGDGEQRAQYLDSGDHAFIDPARTRPFVAHMWRRITRAPMRKAVAAAVDHVRALWSPALERGKKAFVGKRIAVYWPDDDAWYTGSIQSYDGKEGKHSVMYDDGIDEMLKLSDEVAYVLNDAAAEEAVAAYSAVGKCMYCGKLGKLCDKNSLCPPADEPAADEASGSGDGEPSPPPPPAPEAAAEDAPMAEAGAEEKAAEAGAAEAAAGGDGPAPGRFETPPEEAGAAPPPADGDGAMEVDGDGAAPAVGRYATEETAEASPPGAEAAAGGSADPPAAADEEGGRRARPRTDYSALERGADDALLPADEEIEAAKPGANGHAGAKRGRDDAGGPPGKRQGVAPKFGMLQCGACRDRVHIKCLEKPTFERRPDAWEEWKCLGCKTCEGCKEDGTKIRLATCDECEKGWHIECLPPPHGPLKSWPSRGFKCPDCAVCNSCGTTHPKGGWYKGYEMCTPCGRKFAQKQYCPICMLVYNNKDMNMIQCDSCQVRWGTRLGRSAGGAWRTLLRTPLTPLLPPTPQFWIHSHCDKSTSGDVESLADQDAYSCPNCRGERTTLLFTQVLERLQKEDRDGFFAEPVSAEYALHTNYHSVVQDPMDFQTMRAKISRGASRDSNRGHTPHHVPPRC